MAQEQPNALSRLTQSNQTLGGAAAVTGAPTPLSPVAGATLGANADAAKMAGSSAQKLTALRESVKESRDVDFQAPKEKQKSALTQKLEQDALAFAQLTKMEDRTKALAAKKIQDSLTSIPVDQLLTKVNPEYKGFLNTAFFDPNATKEQKSKAIVDLAAKAGTSFDYNKIANMSNIAGMATVLKDLGVANATEAEIAETILGNIPQEAKVSEALSPNTPEWEAVFGIGAPESALADTLSRIGASPNMKWSEIEPLIKSYQAANNSDWATLQKQAQSNNPAIRSAAQQTLIEQGYFGADTIAGNAEKLTQDIASSPNLVLNGVAFDGDKLRSKDPTEKTKFTNLLTKAAAGTLEDKTLQAALQKSIKSGEFNSYLDDADLAAIKQVNDIKTANTELMAMPKGQGLALSSDIMNALMPPELLNALNAGGRAVSLAEMPGWFQVMKGGGEQATQFLKALQAAQTTPSLMQAFKSMTKEQIAASTLVSQPDLAIENIRKRDLLSQLLTGSKTNSSDRLRLTNELFPNGSFGRLQEALNRSGKAVRIGDKIVNGQTISVSDLAQSLLDSNSLESVLSSNSNSIFSGGAVAEKFISDYNTKLETQAAEFNTWQRELDSASKEKAKKIAERSKVKEPTKQEKDTAASEVKRIKDKLIVLARRRDEDISNAEYERLGREIKGLRGELARQEEIKGRVDKWNQLTNSIESADSLIANRSYGLKTASPTNFVKNSDGTYTAKTI